MKKSDKKKDDIPLEPIPKSKPSEKEVLENRKLRVDIMKEIKKMRNEELESRENVKSKQASTALVERSSINDDLFSLMLITQLRVIDNEESKGKTEPVYVSMWDEEAMDFFRKTIIKKVKKL